MLQFELLDPAAEPCALPLAVTIGERIALHLVDGCHLTRGAISALLADESGVESWGTAWSIDDFNDAIEIGALLWLRSHGRIALDTAAHEAVARFEWLDAALPPRHVRSEAQIELQQFSTPPMLSWLMARAAQLRASDTVLDPSAGNGALALWPAMHGCGLGLNEIDPDRRQSLAQLFPGTAVTAHDGELIDHLLGHCPPTAVLMNPPFARSRERGHSAATAARHLRSAMRLSRNGARLVAIMPDGFDASRFASAMADATLRLDARIAGAFRRSGTGIPVRLVVFDKIADGQAATTAETDDLAKLTSLIDRLPPRARGPSSGPIVSVRPAASLLAKPARIRPAAPFATHPVLNAPFEVLDYAALDDPAPVPEQTGIYLPYRPSRIQIEGAPVHPTPLVESVAMGSVAAPIPAAQPRLPAGWRERALLSEAQLETLVYAGEAFSHDLPRRFRAAQEGTSLEQAENGARYRQGFFLGDGTGAGKGRQIASVIMDRWLSGERRHIWITKNEALLEDARRDWEALGGMRLDIQPLSSWKLVAPVQLAQGILFVTYPTLRSGRAEDTRLDQVLAWAGDDFEGVIAFGPG
jgi:predicted RNA methylase